MLKTIALLFALTLPCFAATNILTLTWSQPPGYSSTLYYSTNLAGEWSLLSTNPPPYSTEETNQVAYFTVIVAPPQVRYNFAGTGNPSYISALAGSSFIDTNSYALWFKFSDAGTNDWQQEIGP